MNVDRASEATTIGFERFVLGHGSAPRHHYSVVNLARAPIMCHGREA